MTKLIYLTDSYKKSHTTKVVEVLTKGTATYVVLEETIFYPEGGGQPSDKGVIKGKEGSFEVTHVRMKRDEVVHEGKITGTLKKGDEVELEIDWEGRYDHMRRHSAGHLVHEITKELVPSLVPIKGEHDKHAYIEYEGFINPKIREVIEKRVNMLVASDKPLTIELVTLEELEKRSPWVPPHLPKNKPLRILQVADYPPIPDGGTQVKLTSEVGPIKITEIEQLDTIVRVHYATESINNSAVMLNSFQHLSPQQNPKSIEIPKQVGGDNLDVLSALTLQSFQSSLLELQQEIMNKVEETSTDELETLKVSYLGSHGTATLLIKTLKDLPANDKKSAGMLVNEFKTAIKQAFANALSKQSGSAKWLDTSLPGVRPREGHLHIVTQAIMEITRIFERIGFTRARHPEVDWDYYAFEALNMPANHPARDEWETFFIEYPGKPSRHSLNNRKQSKKDTRIPNQSHDDKFGKIVLTPHTSNGQVREMEKGHLPIRMINIAKCYRRQSDVSHVPMFHQFEGLYVDTNVSIGHLSGVFDYFVKQFYGTDRKIRLRPFHFQFTEPSFEVDINCAVCLGTAKLPNGDKCRLCKSGWLEIGGAGMVHPNVLKYGGIDPSTHNGFAFGWGVERVYMMKSGTKLDDIRLLYGNDIRFLEQF